MKLYFSGIGGKAIAPLANLALDAGHQVFGSDPHIDNAITNLIKRGVIFSTDQSSKFLNDIHKEHQLDWVIRTSALPINHPEIAYAKEQGIKCTKRDSFLSEFISQHKQKLIAVAGTHGKTTTTTMLVWLFKELGLPLSYLVGSDLSFDVAGKFDEKAEFFAYECDEFDHNFLHFFPDHSLIPSITYDHKEIYPTLEDYRQAFAQFIKQSKQTWMWEKDNYTEFADLTNISWLKEADPRFKRFGMRNRQNATMALQLIKQIAPDQDETKIIVALDNAPLASRRFEEVAKGLFSDYGHLPDEIRAVINLAQEYASANNYRDLTIVYQPYQNMRQYQIYHEYPDVFKSVKTLYWAPTSLIREKAEDREILSQKFLTKGVDQAQFVELDDGLVAKINQALAKNELVLFIAGGGGDEWLRNQLDKIVPGLQNN